MHDPRSLQTIGPVSARPERARSGRALIAVFLPLAALQLGADTTGCRSEASDVVQQDRIWTGYWAFYDRGGDTTDLRATFRLGSAAGTPLVLEPPAQVSFLGQTLAFDAVWDWHSTRVTGQASGSAFEYRDADGNEYSAPLQPFRSAELPSTFSTAVDRSNAVTLGWDGPPLGPDETVEVVIASASNRLDFVAFFQTDPGATSIVLDAQRLSRVGSGAAVLVIRRSVRSDLAVDPGAGGQMTMTYQTAEYAIELL